MADNEGTVAARDPSMKSSEAVLESPPPSSRIRWLFLGVCAALLVLLLASSLLAVRYLNTMHAQELAITRALDERSQMLSSLWLAVQNYNDSVQQFVAETQVAGKVSHRRQLDALTLEIDSGLSRYPVQRDSAEAALLETLRGLFIQQRTVYVAIVDREAADHRPESQALLLQRIKPLQRQMMDWSARLRTWNQKRGQFADASRLAEYSSAQGGLARTLAIGLGSGLLLVLAGMAYIVRLERQTDQRYAQLAQSRRESQFLAARLLDAQEDERRSISRELHDEIGQSLGVLLVDLSRLSNAPPGNPEELKAQLGNMKSLTERTFQAVRNIALLLRPSMLDDLGLVAALEWQGREVSRRSEMEVEVQSENVSSGLPDEVTICVYRIVQEALNNAVRHSGAKNARIILSQSPRGLQVRVTDDGRGFDTARARGLGLLGMEERVSRLGGKLTNVSSPSGGTEICGELPVPVPL
jgi:signal transduction histidine kinase